MRRTLIATLFLLAGFIVPVLGQSPDPTDLDLDGVPGVAGPPANPQPLASSVLTGTGSILIDRSHHGNFDVSGFMNFLASQGWVITEHALGGGAITPSILAGHDILLVPTRFTSDPTDPYSVSEVAAIQSFVLAGGGLWVIHDNRPPAGVNTLAQAFGVTFQYDFIQDPSNNEGGQPFTPTIHILGTHPITEGITSYGYYLGDCLGVTPPAEIMARADDDAYSLYCPAGSFPPTLAVYENGGRAVFAGDISPLHPNVFPSRLRLEDQILLQNIVNWLLGDSPTATSPTTWGSVKALYADEKELTAMP